jgi:ribonuclease-3
MMVNRQETGKGQEAKGKGIEKRKEKKKEKDKENKKKKENEKDKENDKENVIKSGNELSVEDVVKMLSLHLPPDKARVADLSLYRCAMVHKSFAISVGMKRVKTYERLEFLGDSVLSMIVASYLYERYPDQDECFMTRMRTKLVNGKMLADLCSRHTPLPSFVSAATSTVSWTVLEDVFEAFLGALFLDGGFDVCRLWLVGFLERNVDFSELAADQVGPKESLNRHCMRNLGYILVSENLGTETSRDAFDRFDDKYGSKCRQSVRLRTPDGTVVSTGCGDTRKEAEDAAVRRAIEYYGIRK